MKTSTAMVCVMALAACGKGGAKASGALSSDEMSLFKELPGGNVALFGGNLLKAQDFFQSKLGKQLSAVAAPDSKSQAWMTCFMQGSKVKMAGAVANAGKDVSMRMVFSGLKPTEIADCAKKAEYPVTVDPDGKYVSVEISTNGMQVTQGYLQLPSGDLYSRTTMAISIMPTIAPATRADYEAEVASAGKATSDGKLTDLLAKVDRSRAVWFAGTAAGTPLADKLGEVYGTMDFDGGIAMDVTVQIMDSKMADKVADGIKEAKSMADKMPGELKGVIDNLEFSRDGDHLHFADKLTDSQLSSLMSMGAMGGLGGRKHHSID